MSVTLDGITSQLQVMYQSSVEQAGKLLHYSVRLLNPCLELVRQDARLAALTVVVANILFVLIAALLVARIAKKFLAYYFGPQAVKDGSWGKQCLSNMMYLTLVGLNVTLYQRIQLPLSPLIIAIISLVTSLNYLFYLFPIPQKNESS